VLKNIFFRWNSKKGGSNSWKVVKFEWAGPSSLKELIFSFTVYSILARRLRDPEEYKTALLEESMSLMFSFRRIHQIRPRSGGSFPWDTRHTFLIASQVQLRYLRLQIQLILQQRKTGYHLWGQNIVGNNGYSKSWTWHQRSGLPSCSKIGPQGLKLKA
jgi:hypothetical protein